MRIFIFIIMLLFLTPTHSQAAKAAVVTSTATAGTQVTVSLSVSDNSGTVFLSTSFNVNFASSTNQMNADIKAKIRDVLAGYGIILTVNDIVLFGGAL